MTWKKITEATDDKTYIMLDKLSSPHAEKPMRLHLHNECFDALKAAKAAGGDDTIPVSNYTGYSESDRFRMFPNFEDVDVPLRDLNWGTETSRKVEDALMGTLTDDKGERGIYIGCDWCKGQVHEEPKARTTTKVTHTGPGFQPHKHQKGGPMHGETVPAEEEEQAKTLALGESEEPPLYVEYHKEKEGEVPVQFGGETYLPVWARYPGGKIDVGYYSQAGDVTYGYDALRKLHGV